MRKLSLLLVGLILVSCAKERAVKPVLRDGRLVAKNVIADNIYLFHKQSTDVKAGGGTAAAELPIGYYLQSEKLVKLVVREFTLDVVSIDPLFKEDVPALSTGILAQFPVEHVDILRKQNVDGDNTHEEEETTTRRPWQEREYVKIDISRDMKESLAAESKLVTGAERIDLAGDAINFAVKFFTKDDAEVTIRYSMLKYDPESSYVQREYPLDVKQRFGYFATNTYKFDQYGRITQTDRKTYMNRWDTSKKVVYYLSKDFPSHLIKPTRQVFAKWNEAFKSAVGRDVLEIHENSGQELGDLRYNMITYDPSVDASHGILGYGPSVANPRTGEIVKADVLLYGGVLKSSLERTRRWDKLLGDFKPQPIPEQSVLQSLFKILLPGQGLFNQEDVLTGKVAWKNSGRFTLDRELVQNLRTEMAPRKFLAEMEKQKRSKLKRVATEVDMLSVLDTTEDVKKLSDEELEVALFMPLLAHELGHNLGLRHNFAGSFDEKHFEGDLKSSSIMDYGYLNHREPPHPAPYDRAAIAAAYSPDKVVTEKLMAENYYFCTDEDTMSSESAYCARHDAGTTLTKIVESQFLRYNASWFFSNLRLDRVHFNTDPKSYQQRVASMIIPLRLMYDNATAILEAAEEESPTSLWRLVRQRIEADPSSKAENVVSIQLMTKVILEDADEGFSIRTEQLERKVDKTKIEAVVKDATEARQRAFVSMAQLILDESKPLHSGGNLVERDLEIKGIIINKLLGMIFMGSGFPDPLGSGKVLTLYNDIPTFRRLLTSILSNTQFFADDKDFSGYDINLREMAFETMKDELVTSGAAPVAREAFAVEKVILDPNNPELVAQQKIRSDVRGQLKKVLGGNLSPEEVAAAMKEVVRLRGELSKVTTVAYAVALGNRVYAAPLAVDNHETATGRIITTNILSTEDIQLSAKELKAEIQAELDAETKKPEAERDTAKIAALMAQLTQIGPRLDRIVEGTAQTLAEHKLLLERFYQFYAN